MSALDIISGILLILSAVFIVILVCMQEGKSGLGVVSGETGETVRVGKNHAKTMSSMLVKGTKVAGTIMIILTILVTVINVYL